MGQGAYRRRALYEPARQRLRRMSPRPADMSRRVRSLPTHVQSRMSLCTRGMSIRVPT